MNKSSTLYVLGFMVALAAVFGFGVSLVHYSTQAMLAKNERLHRNRTLGRAFMLKPSRKSAEELERLVQQRLEKKEISYEGRTWTVYVSRDGEMPMIGFVFSGMGFWDRITGIIVLETDLQRVLNIAFLGQKETPGLGARIEEEEFTNRFENLAIAWEAPPDQRIVLAGAADNQAPNAVQGITGATQTSMALVNMLNEELARFREVYRNMKQEILATMK